MYVLTIVAQDFEGQRRAEEIYRVVGSASTVRMAGGVRVQVLTSTYTGTCADYGPGHTVHVCVLYYLWRQLPAAHRWTRRPMAHVQPTPCNMAARDSNWLE